MPDLTTDNARPNGYLSGEFRKLFPTLVVAILTAFGTSWWKTQTVQNDTLHRLEQVENKAEKNAENIATNSQTTQANAIRLAEMGAIQNAMLEQIRDIKVEQQAINQRLRR